MTLTGRLCVVQHQLPEIKEAVRSSMKDDNIEPTDERFREAMLQHLNSIFIALDEKVWSEPLCFSCVVQNLPSYRVSSTVMV